MMKILKPNWVAATHQARPIFSCDIQPDGTRFATGGQGEDCGKICVWSMASIRHLIKSVPEGPQNQEQHKKDHEASLTQALLLAMMESHLGCVNCVRWSFSGRYLASGADDRLIMVWQLAKSSSVFPSSSFGSSSMISPAFRTSGGTGGMPGSIGATTDSNRVQMPMKVEGIEHWRCVFTLRGHLGDVLDLAWSSEDRWLASCSVDNHIIVWNGQRLPEKIKVLEGHKGLVKGVSWDPVGKYLASQSDDKTLRVWKTSDWSQEVCIEKPFVDCCATTHTLRCAWSTDGFYIVSAHAMNNEAPTSQIIWRNRGDGWRQKYDFVGHRKAIGVVKFNPRILQSTSTKNADKNISNLTAAHFYSCCAMGSRDRSLSIWLTGRKRPVAVLHDLFENSILDIAWSSTGRELICCSHDGTLAYIRFGKHELGTVMSRQEMMNWYRESYGCSFGEVGAGDPGLPMKTNLAGPVVIESVDVLKLQEQKIKQEELAASQLNKNELNHNFDKSVTDKQTSNVNGRHTAVPASTALTLNKQIETKTRDGKRRIQPILIAPGPDVNDDDDDVVNCQKLLSECTKENHQIGMSDEAGVKSASDPTSKTDLESTKPPVKSTMCSTNDVTASQRDEVAICCNGPVEKPEPSLSKYRKQDVQNSSVPSLNQAPALTAPVSSISTSSTAAGVSATASTKNSSASADLVKMRLEMASEQRRRRKNRERSRKYRQRQGNKSEKQRPGKTPSISSPTDQGDETTAKDGRQQTSHQQSGVSASEDHPRSIFTPGTQQLPSFADKFQLPPPQLLESLNIPLPLDADTNNSTDSIEILNDFDRNLSTVRHTQNSRGGSLDLFWEISCTGCVSLASASKDVIVLATTSLPSGPHSVKTLHAPSPHLFANSNNCLILNSSSGRCILPPIRLDSYVSHLVLRVNHLLLITGCGTVHLWNTVNMKPLVEQLSVFDLFPDGAGHQTQISSCHLTQKGLPVIRMSTGHMYTLHSTLHVWLELGNTESLQSFQHILHSSPVSGALREAQTEAVQRADSSRSLNEIRQQRHSKTSLVAKQRTFLELQLAGAQALQSGVEYSYWLSSYVSFLCRQADEKRLREICIEVLGPPSERKSLFLGLDRRNLLSESLQIIGSEVRFQRLYNELRTLSA